MSDENKNIIEKILEKELHMFLTVPVMGRAGCQEHPVEFQRHRKAQFSTWSREALKSYLNDLVCAEKDGINLMTLKYARMGDQIPCLNDDPQIEQIVEIQYAWQKEMFKKYPHLMSRGRLLDSRDDTAGHTSFETYLRGELETYSSETLRHLYREMENARQKSINLNEKVYEFLVESFGFPSVEAAEAAVASPKTH
jgi:hypothetical protein